ncbi:hypothetical protein AKO1_015300, partial [Acrasis kona]
IDPNDEHNIGLSWLQLSTGEFNLSKTTISSLSSELVRLSPSEILVSRSTADLFKTKLKGYITTPCDDYFFELEPSKNILDKQFGSEFDLDQCVNVEITSSGALLQYILKTQKGKIPRFDTPNTTNVNAVMAIDASTRRSLELTKTLGGTRTGSLLAVMDRTVTGPGARLLLQKLQTPSTVASEIEDRLDAVEFFVGKLSLMNDVRDLLRNTHDVERSLQRLHLDRGTPVDLYELATSMDRIKMISKMISINSKTKIPSLLKEQLQKMSPGLFDEICKTLLSAIKPVQESTSNISEGGYITDGFSKELDDKRYFIEHSESEVDRLKEEYKLVTKINSLKIKFNNQVGYFVEVNTSQADKLKNSLKSDGVRQMQSTATCVRFRTNKLYKLEDDMSNAKSESINIEKKIFDDLKTRVLAVNDVIVESARALSQIDVFCSLATLARENQYSRPIINDKGLYIVKNGRHPIVEQARLIIRDDKSRSALSGVFVGNDCILDDDKSSLLLVTGPNMGGKSTYLRQNALIAIMAQMGSFVPADKGTSLNIVDKLFSRVGASDELANDRSTFMVEMTETANILQQATNRSLVIIDEIGRGTATLDGLAIAWSVLEYLHNVIKCKGLFATHFHELTDLAGTSLPRVSPCSLGVSISGRDLIFNYRVEPRACDESYGVHVARLAGLPDACIDRAEHLLTCLKDFDKKNLNIQIIKNQTEVKPAKSGRKKK